MVQVFVYRCPLGKVDGNPWQVDNKARQVDNKANLNPNPSISNQTKLRPPMVLNLEN